jgi:hypothetical protein
VSISDSNIRQYSAISPEAILRSAEINAVKYERIRSNIEKIIPEMKALHKDTKQRPLVKIFEGKEGLISALAETLTAKDKTVRVCTSAKMLFEVIPEFLPLWIRKRVESNVFIKMILPLTKATREIVQIEPKLYDAVYIPEEKYSIPADIAIWDNKIAYGVVQGSKITTIMIESEEVTGIMRGIYDMAFAEGERIGKKETSA